MIGAIQIPVNPISLKAPIMYRKHADLQLIAAFSKNMTSSHPTVTRNRISKVVLIINDAMIEPPRKSTINSSTDKMLANLRAVILAMFFKDVIAPCY